MYCELLSVKKRRWSWPVNKEFIKFKRNITKAECYSLLKDNHYLSKIQKGFKSGINFGIFYKDKIIGVCIFTGFPVPELSKGCYGLERNDQEGLYELSRLVLCPFAQSNCHNLASWFISKCLKIMKKEIKARAILSYADTNFHNGIVYAASNFKYYGLSVAKKDFFYLQDGNYIKHSRGKTKGVLGKWMARSQKHRFLITFDKKLSCKWVEEKWCNL